MTVLCNLLQEKKVVLHTRNLFLLTPVAETLRSFLNPLQWQYAYIPVLPMFISPGVLEAPMPVFVGMHTDSLYGKVHTLRNEDVCLVDLDEDRIVLFGSKPVPLPLAIKATLQEELETCAGLSTLAKFSEDKSLLEAHYNCFNEIVPPDEVEEEEEEGEEREEEDDPEESDDDKWTVTSTSHTPPTITAEDPGGFVTPVRGGTPTQRTPSQRSRAVDGSGTTEGGFDSKGGSRSSHHTPVRQTQKATASDGTFTVPAPRSGRLGRYLASPPSFGSLTGRSTSTPTPSRNTRSNSISRKSMSRRGSYADSSRDDLNGSRHNRRTSSAVSGQRSGGQKGPPAFSKQATRAAFLHVLVQLFGHYRDFLQFPELVVDQEMLQFDQLFDVQAFVAACPKQNRAFVKALTQTQKFAHFVEEKTYSSAREAELDFFDTCCDVEARVNTLKEELRNKLKGRRATLPRCNTLVHHLASDDKKAIVYSVPPPNLAGLDLDVKTYSYERFPMLTLPLLGRPRPVDVKYIIDVSKAKRRSRALDFDMAFNKQQRPAFDSVLLPTFETDEAWARYLLRCVYSAWFELQAECIATHSDIPQAIVNVFRVLDQMKAKGMEADEGVYRSILIICGKYHRRDQAKAVFESMKKSGVKPTAVTYGAYASALAEGRAVNGSTRTEKHMEDGNAFSQPFSPPQSPSSAQQLPKRGGGAGTGTGAGAHHQASPSTDSFASDSTQVCTLFIKFLFISTSEAPLINCSSFD